MAGAPAVAALSLLAMTRPAHGAGARGHGPDGPSMVAAVGPTTANPAFPSASEAAQGLAHVMQSTGLAREKVCMGGRVTPRPAVAHRACPLLRW